MMMRTKVQDLNLYQRNFHPLSNILPDLNLIAVSL